MSGGSPASRARAAVGTCAAHPGAHAVAVCHGCGRSLCSDCREVVHGAAHCRRCGLEAVREDERDPSDPAVVVGTLLLGAGVAAVALAIGVGLARDAAVVQANHIGLERVGFALDDFFLDQSRYPRPDEGLAALLLADPRTTGIPLSGWTGPYLTEAARPVRFSYSAGTLLDAWDHEVLYYVEPDERSVYIASAGPDGHFESQAIGELAFSGQAEGDDQLVWVQRP